jgi:hypothetical protein
MFPVVSVEVGFEVCCATCPFASTLPGGHLQVRACRRFVFFLRDLTPRRPLPWPPHPPS